MPLLHGLPITARPGRDVPPLREPTPGVEEKSGGGSTDRRAELLLRQGGTAAPVPPVRPRNERLARGPSRARLLPRQPVPNGGVDLLAGRAAPRRRIR